MKLYKLSEFAKLIQRSESTLRDWDRKGVLKPHSLTPGGHRMYSEKQVQQFLGLPDVKESEVTANPRKVIGYCRVSTRKQKDDLERQIEYVKSYMCARGYSFEIITDVGSGINYSKSGLTTLLQRVMRKEVDKVVILYKDRLVRFGFELIETVCQEFNTEIEIIDQTEKTQEQELVEDMIQIITVFSCRLQGKRANKAKKILKEVKVYEQKIKEQEHQMHEDSN